ncbi:Sucrase/ferredoxin-like-domain-containing protein, partial [Leucosporidium creatinivorum]
SMTGFTPRPAVSPTVAAAFEQHSVPTQDLETACAGCAHLDGDELDDYPKGFDVDLDSEMLGSMSAYGRQILISTGLADWEREVTDSGLPANIKAAYDEASSSGSSGFLGKLAKKLKGGDSDGAVFKGVYPSSAALATPSSGTSTPSAAAPAPTRLSILNASLLSSSDSHSHQSVIILPDFKVVHQVGESKEAASELVEGYLRPAVGRAGVSLPKSVLRSWPLPYSAVVLLCSHKRRDKRCHIAAPLLLNQFHHHLEHHGGHRYAGNVIIYLPNGTSIWYGRVTPRDIGAVVETTIMNGKVIPELLRGGLGLTEKNGPEGLLGW